VLQIAFNIFFLTSLTDNKSPYTGLLQCETSIHGSKYFFD